MRTAICTIYDKRPEMCRKYPKPDNYIPLSCGYFFPGDGRRQGECDPKCGGACCKVPRKDGEPEGQPMMEEMGGMPCKYLEEKEE